MSKKLFSVLIILSLLLTTFNTIGFADEEEVKVNLNGEIMNFDDKPVIVNGSTLVPLRAIFEAMGADIK